MLSNLFSIVDVAVLPLNYFSREWRDPVIFLLAKLLGVQTIPAALLMFQRAILIAGCLLLIGRAARSNIFTATASVFLLLAPVFAIFGNDLYLGKIQWFPFLIWSLQERRRWRPFLPIAASVLFVSLWGLTSGGLGALGVLVAALTNFALRIPVSSSQVTFGIILSTLLPQIFPLGDYPGDAHLSPISPLTFEAFPFVGQRLVPNPLLYTEMWSETFQRFDRGMIVLLPFFFAGLSDRKSMKRSFFFFCGAAGSAILLGLELFVPPSFHQVSPFRVLLRIVPGLALNPLPWLTWGIIVFGVNVWFLRQEEKAVRSLSVALAVSFLVTGTAFRLFDYRLRGLVSSEQVRTSSRYEDLSRSPSAFVVRTAGQWTAQGDAGQVHSKERLRFLRPVKELNWHAVSSVNSDQAKTAIDGMEGTRWQTGRPQTPGDTFTLTLDRAVTLLRVELPPGDAKTDFPRGIRLEGSRDGVTFETLLQQGRWLGPVRWTPSGLPYFGPQPEVSLDLPKPVVIKSLRLTQLSEDRTYDWSISEVRLFGPKD